MKVKGNGQGKILTAGELTRLFCDGLTLKRDRCLFAICLFTGCRISEALSLQKSDIKNHTITFRKSTTKGKLKTRTVDTPFALSQYLDEYEPPTNEYNPYLFPSREGKHLTRISADKILRAACKRISIEGVSTHSFRRTALTQMQLTSSTLMYIMRVFLSEIFRRYQGITTWVLYSDI